MKSLQETLIKIIETNHSFKSNEFIGNSNKCKTVRVEFKKSTTKNKKELNTKTNLFLKDIMKNFKNINIDIRDYIYFEIVNICEIPNEKNYMEENVVSVIIRFFNKTEERYSEKV